MLLRTGIYFQFAVETYLWFYFASFQLTILCPTCFQISNLSFCWNHLCSLGMLWWCLAEQEFLPSLEALWSIATKYSRRISTYPSISRIYLSVRIITLLFLVFLCIHWSDFRIETTRSEFVVFHFFFYRIES